MLNTVVVQQSINRSWALDYKSGPMPKASTQLHLEAEA